MIQKFVEIKGIGRFADYTCQGDVTLAASTVIYAENGRGKSTLCMILRSLANNDVIHIQPLEHPNSATPAQVKILLDDGLASYDGSTWSARAPNILLFDNHFVEENVYTGSEVQTEHGRNLCRLILGDTDTKLAKEVDRLQGAIHEQTTDLKAKELEIRKHINGQTSIDRFLRMPPLQDGEKLISAKTHCCPR